jgi:predicted HTH domain antitoxin
MAETVSVRVAKEELREIRKLSELKQRKNADILREVLHTGVESMKLDLALEKFRKNEATATKAAELAGIPLTRFLDVLAERKLELHYTIEDLREDMEEFS